MRHGRRFRALYVIVLLWCLMITLVPTRLPSRSGSASASKERPQSSTRASDTTLAPGDAPTSPGASLTVASGSTATGTTPVAPVQLGTGVTRGGYPCAPGVRQVPWSEYAPPCVAKFTGSNGGATYRGVTSSTIALTLRTTVDNGGPAQKQQDQITAAQGGATTQQRYDDANVLLPWFNKNYELFGRRVVLSRFNGQGNSIDEAQDRGQDAACTDATAIAKTVGAFAELAYPFNDESGVFAECAAREHLFLPLAGTYYPESYYRRWDPYVWDNTMQCERITHDLAEYVGKRLNNRHARWAGDATYRASTRKFALYVPNDPPYQRCADNFEHEFKSKYGGTITSRYDYALDVSQFPSEALRASVRFQAAHATTVLLACDSISPTFLTNAAQQQGWHPEWVTIGVGGVDDDGSVSSYDPSEVDGHFFGMSQAGATTAQRDPNGEAARAWKEATNGQALPVGAEAIYWQLVDIFVLLQAGGPVLTPEHIAAGARALPPMGGSTAVDGTWSWAVDHGATVDSREVFWDATQKHLVATYSGRRFQSGQWPAEEPPIYPGH